MRILSLLLLLLAGFATGMHAQQPFSYGQTDSSSYALYQQGRWKELLQFGKQAVSAGQDFPLLRMRMGYAAFVTGRYSEAIRQYEKVLKEDALNETAHYFIYWSRVNLGQSVVAMASLPYTQAADIPVAQRKISAVESAEAEFSYKQNSITDRGNPFYFRAGLGHRFSHRVHMEHALAVYRQTLNEPGLTAVNNNDDISIGQFEYYNRVRIQLDRHWQLKGAWHYVRTPFNNFSYNNHLLLFGIKYHGAYASLQADLVLGRITDSSRRQFNLEWQWFPLGNMKVYSFSTAMLRNRQTTDFHYRQVLGFQVYKNTWLEGNITTGTFRNLAENDALYLYNAIDPNKVKAGAALYFLVGKTRLQIGYTYEQRERFATKQLFQQHSINGGLSWTL